MLESSLRLSRELFGDRHPNTLKAMNSLGVTYSKLGKDHESELLFKECLTLQRETMGNNHSQTISVIYNLGQLFSKQLRYTESEELFEECL